MMKALIVEDEYLAREELAYLIREHSAIEIAASVEDGLEAFKFLQENDVDVVFLDINIPSIDGLLLAKNLHKTTRPPRIVFVTAYKEFAVDAFELEAFDYILKPYNETRIASVLARLEAQEPPVSAPAAPAAPQPAKARPSVAPSTWPRATASSSPPATTSITSRRTRKSPWSTPRATAT
ncbi:putative two-component response-regulatory protein YehT [Chromobacterium violaceum]|uniref:Putative two-component response-regulatory protein YehT n=1 Tax=Chromobacterium violaceum TaxID=536 RepID=A0A3S4LJ57_CHRVL|nr:putative two-component response-regulatory protein YehT [Chromobacterium violaceum]